MCGQDLNLTLGAEILGTAFSVFATTTSLGSPQGNNSLAAHDGFLVNANGLGAYSFNIGYNGMAFGVPNLTILNVYQILQAANKSAVNGNAWDSNFTLRNQGLSVFRLLNGEGQDF